MASSSTATGFLKPLTNALRIYMQIEILTAKHFECDDLYIQYMMDLSEDWNCSDRSTLYGITPICKTKQNSANFGYYIEICLEIDIRKYEEHNDLPAIPCLYFEVISQDSWDRYRCEGLAYKSIPVFQPGLHKFELQCIKMHPKNISGSLRRYFIGDYSSINDITWLGIPKDYKENTINKYGVLTEGSGSIQIRLNILNQSLTIGSKRNLSAFSHSHPLLRNFAEIIINYQRARDRMIQARRNILDNP